MGHELSLGGRVSVSVISMLLSEFRFQLCVAAAHSGVCAQSVSEGKQLIQMWVVVLDEIKVVRSGFRLWMQEPHPS